MSAPGARAALVLLVAGAATAIAVAAAVAVDDVRVEIDGGDALAAYWTLAVVLLAVMAVGWWAAPRVPRRPALAVVLLGGALLRVALVPTQPALSDDMYRYLWDGRVQAAGFGVYDHAPAAPALAALRDDAVWPRINRPRVVTIYPPATQALFRAAHAAGLRTPTAWKGLVVAIDLASCLALVAVLRRLGRAEHHVVAYAWNPLPVVAFGHSGHVDAVVVLALLLAVLAWAADRRLLLAGALGLAGAVKLAPLVVVPGFLRPVSGRWSTRGAAVVVGGALAVVAAGYLPLLADLQGALGYLGAGYLQEEGFLSGRRYGLFRAVGLDGRLFVVPVLVAATVAALRSRHSAAVRAAWLSAAFVLLTLAYPWYAVGLLALSVAGGAGVAWPWLAAALELAYVAFFAGTPAPPAPARIRVAAAAATTALVVLAAVSRRARRAVVAEHPPHPLGQAPAPPERSPQRAGP